MGDKLIAYYSKNRFFTRGVAAFKSQDKSGNVISDLKAAVGYYAGNGFMLGGQVTKFFDSKKVVGELAVGVELNDNFQVRAKIGSDKEFKVFAKWYKSERTGVWASLTSAMQGEGRVNVISNLPVAFSVGLKYQA